MAMKLLIKARVTAVIDETPCIRRFQMQPVTRDRFPNAQPGDHTVVLLPNGMRRAYSLCNDTARSDFWEVAVLKEENGLGGSRCIHENVRLGDTLFVSWPQPGMVLASAASSHTFVAGGIGLTPFLSMIPELERRREPYILHMCARSPDDLPFRPLLERLELAGNAKLWFSNEQKDRMDLAETVKHMEPGSHLYCCGPARMIDAFLAAAAGLNPEHVHIERFAGMTAAEASQGEPFAIRLGADGPRLEVPATRSMLSVLREAGIQIEALCKGGACGTCKINYLKGEPVHRDFCLRTADRANTVMACVSRAKGELVLDMAAFPNGPAAGEGR